jgi:hypothetical protein
LKQKPKERITIRNLDNELYKDAQDAANRLDIAVGPWISQAISDKLNNTIAKQRDLLTKALTAIIDECPNPKLPYGKAIVSLASVALANVNVLNKKGAK